MHLRCAATDLVRIMYKPNPLVTVIAYPRIGATYPLGSPEIHHARNHLNLINYIVPSGWCHVDNLTGLIGAV